MINVVSMGPTLQARFMEVLSRLHHVPNSDAGNHYNKLALHLNEASTYTIVTLYWLEIKQMFFTHTLVNHHKTTIAGLTT